MNKTVQQVLEEDKKWKQDKFSNLIGNLHVITALPDTRKYLLLETENTIKKLITLLMDDSGKITI